MADERADRDGLKTPKQRDRPRVGLASDEVPLGSHWTGLGGALLLLVLWTAIATGGFMFIEGWSLLDALFMAVITFSTVGYGEVHPLSPPGQVFAIFVMVTGLSIVLYAFSRIGQLVIEGELLDIMGMRRMEHELAELEDHFILCGYGRTGEPVAQGLKEEGMDFCVIELDPDLEGELRDEGMLYVLGDATEEETLEAAGIRHARGLLALLPSNADNLYLTMTAKGLNEGLRVIARATNEGAEAKLRRVGADDVVSPNRMAGQRVLQAAIRPTVVEFMELVGHRENLQLSMEEVEVAEDSELADKSLEEADLRSKAGVIIVAIKRPDDEMVFNPRLGDVVRARDKLVALGEKDDLESLAQLCGA